MLISRGANPGHQCVSPFSVSEGKRRQPLPRIVVSQFINPTSRAEQPHSHDEGLVGGLHRVALVCTPSVEASQQ